MQAGAYHAHFEVMRDMGGIWGIEVCAHACCLLLLLIYTHQRPTPAARTHPFLKRFLFILTSLLHTQVCDLSVLPASLVLCHICTLRRQPRPRDARSFRAGSL